MKLFFILLSLRIISHVAVGFIIIVVAFAHYDCCCCSLIAAAALQPRICFCGQMQLASVKVALCVVIAVVGEWQMKELPFK